MEWNDKLDLVILVICSADAHLMQLNLTFRPLVPMSSFQCLGKSAGVRCVIQCIDDSSKSSSEI